jgi:hypothetical protein
MTTTTATMDEQKRLKVDAGRLNEGDKNRNAAYLFNLNEETF